MDCFIYIERVFIISNKPNKHFNLTDYEEKKFTVSIISKLQS